MYKAQVETGRRAHRIKPVVNPTPDGDKSTKTVSNGLLPPYALQTTICGISFSAQ